MNEVDQARRDQLLAEAAALHGEARKTLARIFLSELPAWQDARPETPVAAYGADMRMIRTATHIGYVYSLAVNGEPFVEYRSTPASRPGRRHVYGATAAGDVEYAGNMDSIKAAKAEAGRIRKAELQRLRHRSAPSRDGRRR